MPQNLGVRRAGIGQRVQVGVSTLFILALLSACMNSPNYGKNGKGQSSSLISAGTSTGVGVGDDPSSGSDDPSNTDDNSGSETLAITTGPSIAVSEKVQLMASGGTSPYTFSIKSGSGKLTSSGEFEAPSTSTTVTFEVKDAEGSKATKDIQIVGQVPNDPNFSYQSYLGSGGIRGPTAWEYNTDCSSVPVAVIDTGIDILHPDLQANLWKNPGETLGNKKDDDKNGLIDDVYGWNFVADAPGSAAIKDNNFHGTHVAGIIGAAGNNSTNGTGVCWRAKIMGIKALNKDGEGTISDIVEGINYAIQMKAKVINLSLAAEDLGTTASGNFLKAMKAAEAAGILVVSAAGNSGKNIDVDANKTYPQTFNLSNMINVAAVDPSHEYNMADFSNFGTTKVHIAAPGVDIYSTLPSGEPTDTMKAAGITVPTLFAGVDGTSQASPLVAGAAALVWSKYPDLTVSELRSRILDRAVVRQNLAGKVQGARFLNLENLFK